ncbi:Succinate--hydroxymethylglutarate CoA-transferase [Hondaea fermentalgiana]|uniref:Succinate--hydroxymethylglutarate CoA-transferase n=1 Tax=Hondaea fermentalgiana TaxID=2315210 RepID=A0A2R5GXZ7_9STRA|nr:Succinate--hydroxymethylglutarate CoA-transferase [Hondaea fermentalgiana]|eukprot:GBG33311.1 Succinate--hydroxymethylglutarate CoA-transferase [Hondaea fermentalgiana]
MAWWQSPRWRKAALAGLALVLAAGLVNQRKKRRAAEKALKDKKRKKVEQRTRDPALVNPKEEKLLTGLRVVDMSTHIAAPNVGRCLADLGAEVIKVESPGGDLMRRLLIDFEQPRTFGSIFETQNLGKFSLVLDLKNEKDKETLKDLLRDADVLISNTRRRSLVKLGLTYEDLAQEFPHLIYAHVSAWGVRGADAGLPGYDIGAFWAGTGLAALVNPPEKFSTYPGAVGDQTASQILLSSIQMALLERIRGGRGRKIEVSLIHVGTWVLAPQILTSERIPDGTVPDYNAKPAAKIVDQIYSTKPKAEGADAIIAILYKGSFHDERAAEEELREILELPHDAAHDVVAERISTLTADEVEAKLKGAECLRVRHYQNLFEMWDEFGVKAKDPDYHPSTGMAERSPPRYDDVTFVPRIPMEFSAYPHHGSIFGAPHLGEDSTCVRKNKWLSKSFGLPPPQSVLDGDDIDDDETLLESHTDDGTGAPVPAHHLLHDIVVLEVGDVANRHDVAVAATGKLLAEAGAHVYKINSNPSVDDPLLRESSAVYDHYHSVKTEISSKKEIQRAKANANILLTDLSDERLKALGLDFESLKKVSPSIVVVRLVGSMADADNQDFSALCSAYMNRGLGNVLGGRPTTAMPRFPEHVFENMASAFITSACTGGLLHQARKGTPEVVTVSYERIGLWLGQLGAVSVLRDKSSYQMVAFDRKITQKDYPVFGFMSHKTKDGAWIQLLGLDTKRHLPNILSSLGCKWTTYARAAYSYLFEVDHNDKHLLRKLQPLFITINQSIESNFAKFTREELVATFDANDTWYGPVRMPSQLISYQQQWDNDVFSKGDADSDEVLINSPIRVFAA